MLDMLSSPVIKLFLGGVARLFWNCVLSCSISTHDQNIQQGLLLSKGKIPNGSPNKGRLPCGKGCLGSFVWCGQVILVFGCCLNNGFQRGLPLDDTIRCWRVIVTLLLQHQCQQQQRKFPKQRWLVGLIDSIAIDGSRKDHCEFYNS